MSSVPRVLTSLHRCGSGFYHKSELSHIPKVAAKNELRMTLPPNRTWNIEDQKLAGLGQDRQSKPTLVKSSLGRPLLLSKPSAKALPGYNLVVGGLSVEKLQERPKGYSSRI